MKTKLTLFVAVIAVALFGMGCAVTIEFPSSSKKPANKPTEPEKPEAPVLDPNNESHLKIEAAVRKAAKKPTGELTKADLEKVTDLFLSGYPYGNQLNEVPKGLEKLTQLKGLHLNGNQLIDVKRLEKLTQLTELNLNYNPALTKAQIAELQKALLKCEIIHNAKK